MFPNVVEERSAIIFEGQIVLLVCLVLQNPSKYQVRNALTLRYILQDLTALSSTAVSWHSWMGGGEPSNVATLGSNMNILNEKNVLPSTNFKSLNQTKGNSVSDYNFFKGHNSC
jgi:hypothetical protein